MSPLGICKLCRLHKKLIKAHIIPKSLLNIILKDDPKIYPTKKQGYPKKSPIGIYDENILCEECDNKIIGKWDNYAQKILLTPLKEYGSLSDLIRNGFYEVLDVDYKKLKLFFLSILWRVHITTHNFFSQTKLDMPLSNKIRNMILSDNPSDPDELSIILTRFYTSNPEENDICHILRTPAKSSNSHNYFYFRMADYGILINVGNDPFPEELENFILKPNRKLRIRLRDFKTTNDYHSALETNNLWK